MNLSFKKGSRSKTLAVIVFIVMVIFALRLFYLQIIKHDYYVNLANQSQIKRLEIPPKRGVIYALDGKEPVPLVMNQIVYTIFADPQVVEDKEKIVEVVRKIAGGNTRADIEDLLNKKDTRYQILATKVTRNQADMIKDEGLQGVGFQEETQRVYPEGGLASQTLGFVDYEGIGKYGVESYLNERLTGKKGLLQSVTDISSVPLTIGDSYIDEPAIDGDNVVLSIDRNIQSKTELVLKSSIETFGANQASAIVMNPKNGQIMAMANYPSYDPSKLSSITDLSVLNNDVVSYIYEPGSIIKPFTMAIGIDKGVITPEMTYNNTDYIRVQDRTIQNFTKGHTGEISFQTALNWSLNTGFVTIAQKLGDGNNINRSARDTMYEYYFNRFGFGKKTNIEVAGEVEGILWSPEKTEGNEVRYSNMSFGQGMSLTMVQIASAFCSLVNGGRYYSPTVISGVLSDGKLIPETKENDFKQIISSNTSNEVRTAMYNARNNFFTLNDKAGYYIGGKTGTAEVASDGGYDSESTAGTYLGFGGSEDSTEYVIMVRLSGKDQSFNGIEAMRLFTEISNYMLDYLKIQPKG